MAETIHITICGDGGTGKSSITLRLVRSDWTHEYDPTIEDSYSVTRTIDGIPYFLALTDTAGQEEYRGLWAAANLKSDAFLLVYDITNSSTLETLDYFLEMIDMETEQRQENNARLIKELGNSQTRGERVVVGMAPPVKIVAGNKCDLKDSRVVSAREGLEWARRRGCGFMETSAREIVNIEETFALIVRRVVEARRLYRQQQFAFLDLQAEGSHLGPGGSPQLFPLGLLASGQAISHSRTPALTPEERQFRDDVPDRESKPPPDQNHWLGLGRALSRRVTRLRKSSAAALRVDAAQRSKSESAGSATPGMPAEPVPRSQSVHVVQHGKRAEMEEMPQFSLKHDLNPPSIKVSWWRRILCS